MTEDWYSPGQILKELGLSIEQSLKLLDALCFSLKDTVMFHVGQSHQILRAVIIPDAIQVVDYPSCRKQFVVSFFPNKNMLKDIAIYVSSRVFFPHNFNISSTATTSTTSPTWMLVSTKFMGIMFTTILSRMADWYSTSRTRMFKSCLSYPLAFQTFLMIIPVVFKRLSRTLFFIPHALIIPNYLEIVKTGRSG